MTQFKLSALIALSFLAPAQGAAFLKQALPHVASLTALYAPVIKEVYLQFHYKALNDDMVETVMNEDDRLRGEINEIKTFIDKEFAQYGKSIPNLKVRPSFSMSGYASSSDSNTLDIASKMRDDFFEAGILSPVRNISEAEDIYYPAPLANLVDRQSLVDQIRCVIHHEGNHIRNMDWYKRLASKMILPGAVYGLTLPLLNKVENPIKRGIFKTVSLLPMFWATGILQNMINRHQERLADQVPNDTDLLRGGIAKLESEFAPVDNSFSGRLKHFLFAVHPTHQERIDYFKKRIAAIEAKHENR